MQLLDRLFSAAHKLLGIALELRELVVSDPHGAAQGHVDRQHRRVEVADGAADVRADLTIQVCHVFLAVAAHGVDAVSDIFDIHVQSRHIQLELQDTLIRAQGHHIRLEFQDTLLMGLPSCDDRHHLLLELLHGLQERRKSLCLWRRQRPSGLMGRRGSS